MVLAFLDTNVFLRHLRQDHPVFSPKATAILERVERGELRVRTSDIVIFETVFTLQWRYKVDRSAIAEALLPLIELPGIVLPGKRVYRKTFALFVQHGLAFADCYHVALMHGLKLQEVLSFDRDFDRVLGIKRREE